MKQMGAEKAAPSTRQILEVLRRIVQAERLNGGDKLMSACSEELEAMLAMRICNTMSKCKSKPKRK